MPIPPTTLILNPDGSIYHLNLKPDEVAETIILVGDPSRTALISQHFDSIEVHKQKREFCSQTGYIGNKRLSVIGTGIGAGSIDIVMNELDALVNIDFTTREIKKHITSLNIFRLGTAGALQEDIPVDSCLISDMAFAFDGMSHYYGCQYTEHEKDIAIALSSHFNKTLLTKNMYVAAAAPDHTDLFKNIWGSGITLTSIGFYGPQHRKLRAPLSSLNILEDATRFSSNHYRITNFEMETAAIYYLGKILGHKCCSISTIVANRVTNIFSSDPTHAINKMIEQALDKIV